MIWSQFDKTGIGALTRKQAKEMCKSALEKVKMGKIFNDALFDKTFDMVDADHDGALDIEEFVNLIDKMIQLGMDVAATIA